MRSLIDFTDVQIEGPTIEPLDLDEVKKQRRFSSTSLDTLFDIWTSAARQDFEEMTGLQLLTATREMALDGVPDGRAIQLGRAPVQAIVSVTYDDADGVEQTFDAANYTLLPKRTGAVGFETFPGLSSVVLNASASWPMLASSTTGTTGQSLRIRYLCGFGDAPGAVPELIVYALHQFVGTAHKYGESLQDPKGTLQEIPGVKQVLRNARTYRTLYPARVVA